ncbi:MAG TPA: S8 family serine peptidase [Actinomycetota bacterium]|nr:S8 family serine peptidase [Actinomycetota bacterium]
MRKAVALLLLACLVGALPAASSASTTVDTAKMDSALATVVTEGGYPDDFPIDELVRNYRPGDVYYLAKLDVANADALSALEAAGARLRHSFASIRWVALVSSVDAVDDVAALGFVDRLVLDRVHRIMGTQVLADPVIGDQSKRGTADVGAETLWRRGVTGKGVTVGVADTGIDGLHPDLDDNDWQRWRTPTLASKITSFVDCSPVVPLVEGDCATTPAYDDNGHGTHVSGIATGTAEGGGAAQNGLFPGMAPEASLAGAKVCTAAGACLNSAVMAGLEFLATEKAAGGAGADVVNVSLGSGRFYGAGLFGAEQVTNNDPEAQLVNDLAQRNNVVFAISAGNSGPTLQSTGSPSVASQAISVGAAVADFDRDHPVGETLHGEFGNVRPEAAAAGASAIAGFSSRGPTGDRLIKPDLTAPGVYYVAAESTEGAEVSAADLAHNNHFSTDKTYAVLSGTSMSAPAAAGATALVIQGYRKDVGQMPAYFRTKAALVNTAGTDAYEGSVAGLIGTIEAKATDRPPSDLYPIRNDDWVGVTGEGPGRIDVPAAHLALTKGVIAYTPQTGALDDIHELQPSWSIDDLGPGHVVSRTFVLRGGPLLQGTGRTTFEVASNREARGVMPAPASWFSLPAEVTTAARTDTPFRVGLNVPTTAAPGHYAATIVGRAALDNGVTQIVRIPVQFFVRLVEPRPAEGAGTSIEGPIWASAATDYTYAGLQAEDIYTDWTMIPLRVTEGTERVDLSVYDVDGTDHMDVFAFDQNGEEIDSTVSFFIDHAAPAGALYAPTTKDDPATVSLFDGDDLKDVTLPRTIWLAVSDSGPAEPRTFATYHLDVDVVGGTGGGTTPAERIHSGQHAWWSGSATNGASQLTEAVDLTGVGAAAAPKLKFWTWYQLEDGYDWAYALVSDDGGATWTSLATTAANNSGTTTLDPIGTTGGELGGSKEYPNGLTGTSGQPPNFLGQNPLEPAYTQHTADLSDYAGKRVLLRFAYTSDGGVNLENFYVDDVAIVDGAGNALSVGVTNPDNAETQGAWTAAGNPGFQWVTSDS